MEFRKTDYLLQNAKLLYFQKFTLGVFTNFKVKILKAGFFSEKKKQTKKERKKKKHIHQRFCILVQNQFNLGSISINNQQYFDIFNSLFVHKPGHKLDPKCSFFPQTIRDWNSLTDTLLSAAEGAEDPVAKFTSLVRARD